MNEYSFIFLDTKPFVKSKFSNEGVNHFTNYQYSFSANWDGLDYRCPHSQFKAGDKVRTTYLMTKDGKYFKLRKNLKRKKKILPIGG